MRKGLAVYAGGLHHLSHQCVKTVSNIVNYYANLVSRVKSNTLIHFAAAQYLINTFDKPA